MIKYFSITLLLLFSFTEGNASRTYDRLKISIRDSLELLGQANCGMINLEIAKKIAAYDKQKSIEYAERAVDCSLESNDTESFYLLYRNMGELYFGSWGEVDKAILFQELSLKYANSHLDSSHAFNSLGIMHGEKGALDRALAYFHQALAIDEKHEMFVEIILRKSNIAKVHKLAGEEEKALDYYNQILLGETGTLDLFEQANYMRLAASISKVQGKLKKSESTANDILDLLPEQKAMQNALGFDILNEVYLLIADINIEKNDLDKAYTYAEKALVFSEKENNIEHELDSKLKLLQIKFLKGDLKATIDSGLELAIQIEESGSKIRGTDAHLIISNAYKESENHERALFHYIKYDSLSNEISSERAKTNIYLTEQKSENDHLRFSEQFYKQLSTKQFRTISLLSIITAIMLGLIFLLLKMKNENASLNNQLQDNNVELQTYINSNIKLEQFAYLASHDMKTPLRAIRSFAGLLRMKNKDNLSPKSLEYVFFIESATNRLFKLVTDLLEYSKVNSQLLEYSNFELEPLLLEIEEELDLEIKNNLGTIKAHFNNQTIYGDRQKLKKVLSNLINNSLKFSLKDKPAVIEINVEHLNDEVKVSVTDNGIGIEKDFHKEMFLPYSRNHTQDEYDGTGLGLTIVKEIIDKHEGRIECFSDVGEGSTFVITLPLKKVA